MKFLIDTNILSAYLKGDGRVFNRFIQHSGGLAISAVSVAELYSWVFRAKTNPQHGKALEEALSNLHVLEVDHNVALSFGHVRAALLDQGRPTPAIDLLIACTALTHDLTLVTHNVKDFVHITDLRTEDWLT